MLAKRIIPTILCRGRTLVKGVAYDGARSRGLAAQAVRIQAMRGVDEVVLLDIGATPEGRGPDTGLVRELSEHFFMPLAVGGGITRVEHIQALLEAGADKVVLGTAVFTSTLLERAGARYGCQALVASVDVRARKVWSHCGRQEWPMAPEHHAMLCEDWGAGEILLNAMDREGTMEGYDLELISKVARRVNIPVIASCGAGTYEHMHEALQAGADAVAAGAMFLNTDATPAGAAEYLHQRGIEVRLQTREPISAILDQRRT